jgi:hypothetical protein
MGNDIRSVQAGRQAGRQAVNNTSPIDEPQQDHLFGEDLISRRPSLADRFGIPPFSVLDARQGAWQARKRAWIGLGIQSELGRGGGSGTWIASEETGTPADRQQAYRNKEASPGGSPRPACDYSNRERGDGAGRPIAATSVSQKLAPGGGGCWLGGPKTESTDKFIRSNTSSSSKAMEYAGGYENSAPGSSGTSIFDPVVCEMAMRWFCPDGGLVLDPFAGGSVRGIVAALLNRRYVGIDLRPEQIAANEAQWERISKIAPDAPAPRWIVGDSVNLESLVQEQVDLLFTCPPYYDLEQYSDDPRDLSAIPTYVGFIEVYQKIIRAAVEMLAPDAFAAFVVGDLRDPKGNYRNFPADTTAGFCAAGMALYNDAVLVTSVGSLPIRVGKQFEVSRKLGHTHQNVMVYLKGDARKAAARCAMANAPLEAEPVEQAEEPPEPAIYDDLPIEDEPDFERAPAVVSSIQQDLFEMEYPD